MYGIRDRSNQFLSKTELFPVTWILPSNYYMGVAFFVYLREWLKPWLQFRPIRWLDFLSEVYKCCYATQRKKWSDNVMGKSFYAIPNELCLFSRMRILSKNTLYVYIYTVFMYRK